MQVDLYGEQLSHGANLDDNPGLLRPCKQGVLRKTTPLVPLKTLKTNRVLTPSVYSEMPSATVAPQLATVGRAAEIPEVVLSHEVLRRQLHLL